MGLERRLKRMEGLAGPPCPECGSRPGATDYKDVEIEILWDDLDGTETEEAEPEYCGECGRQTQWVVTWEDLEGSK